MFLIVYNGKHHVVDIKYAKGHALPPEEFVRSERLSSKDVVDLFTTVSSAASLPPAEREELKRTLLALLEPAYRLEINTQLHWTRRA